MSENAFFYTYSATSNQEVLSIRKKYLPKEEAKLNYNPSIKFMKEVINMNSGFIKSIVYSPVQVGNFLCLSVSGGSFAM